MTRVLLVPAVALAVFASSASAARNPFKCGGTIDRYACGQMSAQNAAYDAAKRRLPDTDYWLNMLCNPVGARMRVWHCAWGSARPGAATVTFRGTPNGWRILVTDLRRTVSWSAP